MPTAASYNSKKELLIVNVNYTSNVTTVNAALVYNGLACNNARLVFKSILSYVLFTLQFYSSATLAGNGTAAVKLSPNNTLTIFVNGSYNKCADVPQYTFYGEVNRWPVNDYILVDNAVANVLMNEVNSYLNFAYRSVLIFTP